MNGQALGAAMIAWTLFSGAAEAERTGGDAAGSDSAAPLKSGEARAPEPRPAQGAFALDLSHAKRMELADRKRDEAIEQLRELIPRFPEDSAEKPDLLYQLSEYLWEKSRFLHHREEARFEEAYQAWEDAGSTGEKPRRQQTGAEEFRAEAMVIYEQILAGYPDYRKTDEVLFALAFNLQAQGERKQAVRRYEELIRRHPESAFVPDTYIQLGDYYFESNQLLRAKDAFEKALASEAERIHSYALYKLAWCDFNAGEYEDAKRKLQRVVDYAEERGSRLVILRNEALRDLTVVFVEAGQAKEGVAYFRRKAPEERQERLLAQLASGLGEAGQDEQAIGIWRGLLAAEPLSPRAPEFQQEVVSAFDRLRRRDAVKREVERLADLYRPDGAWWNANRERPGVLGAAFEVSEEAMRRIVTDYHQEAQKTKQVETYRLARDIYRRYLEAFATSDDPRFVSDHAFNLAFYYGEILWTLEEWRPAAEAYDRVVAFQLPERDTAREISQERYRKLAAYNAILAWDKLHRVERGELSRSRLRAGQKVEEDKGKSRMGQAETVQRRSAEGAEEVALTEVEQRLVAACDAYAVHFPGADGELEIRYAAASLYYGKNHFEEAMRRFAEVIQGWPGDERAREAADLTLHVLETREAWRELGRVSREYLANRELAAPGTDFTRRVARVVEGSQYKWVDEVLYQRERRGAEAAEQFLAFVEEFPRSEQAPQALTYATLIFQEAGQLDRAIAAGTDALRRFSRHPLEPKLRYTLARLHEQVAEHERAAELYESFVQSHDRRTEALQVRRRRAKTRPATGAAREAERLEGELLAEAKPWLPDALYNAGLWWEGLGETEKAIAAYRAYTSRFPDRPDVPQVRFGLGALHAGAGRHREALAELRRYSRRYGQDARAGRWRHVLSLHQQVRAHLALGQGGAAARLIPELVRAHGRLSAEDQRRPEILVAFADARFVALEPAWEAYLQIRFQRVATVARDLARKRARLAELERGYAEVLAAGAGEQGIAAMVRIGQAYADLAQKILESPDPRGLDEEQKQLYRERLAELAMPLEDKAAEAWETAAAKAYELAIYNEWTLAAQERLNRLRPGLYPRVRQVPLRGSEGFAAAGLTRTAAPTKSTIGVTR